MTRKLIPLAACDDETTYRRDGVVVNTIAQRGDGNVLGRYSDPETGVVCYVYSAYQRGGVSCIIPPRMPVERPDTTRPDR